MKIKVMKILNMMNKKSYSRFSYERPNSGKINFEDGEDSGVLYCDETIIKC